jgi:hypothetical protein
MKRSKMMVAYTNTSVARFSPKSKAICVEILSDKVTAITENTKITIISFCHAFTLAVLRALNSHSPKTEIAITKTNLRIMKLSQKQIC